MGFKDTEKSPQVTTKHIVTYKSVPISLGSIPNYTETTEETVQVYGEFLEWLNGMNTDHTRKTVVICHSIVNLDEVLVQAIKEAIG